MSSTLPAPATRRATLCLSPLIEGTSISQWVPLHSWHARYEQHSEHCQVARMIVDREGMATEFLASLHAEGRRVVTILQTCQYRDLTSLSDVGTFVPLSTGFHP